MSEQIIPFEGQAYTREVLLQTSAEWAQTPDYVLQAYQTGRETDTGREKTGTGYTVWADLPYDSPDGSPFTADGIDDLANGVPEPTDRVPIVTDIAGVAATATITVGSVVSPTLLTVGSATFTLVDSIDVELPQIEIGETPAATAASIIDAINDEDYAELCGCSAEIDGGDDTLINLTASATGVAGDDIILVSTDADELTVTAFSGGVDAEAVLRKVTVADLGGGGGGVISVADAAARFALTGLGRLATVYQEDNGFYYQLMSLNTGVLVAGAGTASANGLYTPRGTEEGRPYYNKYLWPANTARSAIVWTGTEWALILDNEEIGFTNDEEDVAFPWLSTTWEIGPEGSPPTPTVTQLLHPESYSDHWQALPKIYNANFYVDGTSVVTTREYNGLDTRIDIIWSANGRVDVIAADALFTTNYIQLTVQGRQSASTPVVYTIRSDGSYQTQILAFVDGEASSVAFGDDPYAATALKIEVYPEPD